MDGPRLIQSLDPTAALEHDVVPNDFHGIPFERWLDMLCQFAMIFARNRNAAQCFTTLNTILECNIFAFQESAIQRSQLCRLACAIMLNDSKQVSHSVRWLLKRHPFCTDLYRLYNHANRLCTVGTDYSTSVMQKNMLRFIKAMDYTLMTPQQRIKMKFSSRNENITWEAKSLSRGNEKYIKSHDPVMLSLFGHILSSGGTYPSALNYYFRAFAVTPEDPILNLSIAACYVQHSMKRLSENRQYQLQQGLSFMMRYHQLRTKDNVAIRCQEAEYNIGRIWHTVGLNHLALPAYERCIALRERVWKEANGEPVEDFATEAAYAMVTILSLSGDFKAAKEVTEEVLVIE